MQRLDQARADRDQGQAAVKSAEAAELSAEANLAVLNAQVKEAEGVRAELQTSLDKALLDLSYTTVRAPFDGVTGNKAVQVGQYVQPGTRLCSLVPLDTVYIEANYKETQLETIKPGQPADVAVDAASGRNLSRRCRKHRAGFGCAICAAPARERHGQFHEDRAARACAHSRR